MGAASLGRIRVKENTLWTGPPGQSLGCNETRFVMNFVSKATSSQSLVFAQACLFLSCHSPLTWLVRTLLWEGGEGVGWLGTSLGVGGNWKEIARRVGWV